MDNVVDNLKVGILKYLKHNSRRIVMILIVSAILFIVYLLCKLFDHMLMWILPEIIADMVYFPDFHPLEPNSHLLLDNHRCRLLYSLPSVPQSSLPWINLVMASTDRKCLYEVLEWLIA